MKYSFKHVFVSAAILAGIRLTFQAATAAPAIYNLGTLGGSGSAGSRINNFGHVLGGRFTAGDVEHHSFLYTGIPGSGGVMYDFGDVGV